MANFGDMTITVKADKSFDNIVELTPLIKRLIELLEAHDLARVPTLHAAVPTVAESLPIKEKSTVVTCPICLGYKYLVRADGQEIQCLACQGWGKVSTTKPENLGPSAIPSGG